MVDDLHGKLARFGLVERSAHRSVQTAPSGFVDLCPQHSFEFGIWFLGSCEVGVAHEEALAVVIGIDESAGNVVGGGTANLASGRIIDIDALDRGDELVILLLLDVHVWLAEDHEKVASACLFEQFVTHR